MTNEQWTYSLNVRRALNSQTARAKEDSQLSDHGASRRQTSGTKPID